MSIDIRAERPGDEESLDLVNYLAFEAHNKRDDGIADLHEADLVRYLRAYCPRFDRSLSVVAWDGDRAVGHALFTPADIRLLGETVPALAVGPVAVIPEYQKQAIGGRLLESGHDLGRESGFALAFLVGHPEYYPRHGYRACHGFASITIDVGKLPQPTREYTRLPVCSDDVPWLVERCREEWWDVDFGWLYGDALTEWHAPGMIAHIWWTGDGTRAAYTLAGPGRKWKRVLAEDPEVARDAIATIRPASLEHHPSGWLAQNALDPAWGAAEVKPSDAAMARELQEGALQPVLEALESGERLCGCVNWPIPFSLIP